jgi:hypothetical protein
VTWNTFVIFIVIWRLKAGTVEQEEAAVAAQQPSKCISIAKNKHATTEEPWKQRFLLGPTQGCIVESTSQLKQQSELVNRVSDS